MGLAASLAAAKVLLSTIGAALFLAHEGPERLPGFYVVLALVAIALSSAFTGIVDRAPRIRMAQIAFFVTLVGAAGLRVPIAVDVPGAYHALLASAHIYEIVLDIVFWVVVASFLDTIELKRGTALIYMALAVGGALGGGLTGALSATLPAEDLLLLLPFFGALIAAQFGHAGRRFDEIRERGGEQPEPAGALRNLRLLPKLVAAYPLALLIGLNALTLTILYGLSEYLVFTVYAAEFPDEAELTRFLAGVYALIQVVEFMLLYAVSRPLLGRAGPMVRNLVFPLTSLGCLAALALGSRLPAAIVTHLNAEAVSNAVFQPVNNTNYVALPLRYHGRVRTLADGIFYPGGLALAGVMLMFVQTELALQQVAFIAITFALVFTALNVGVGSLFLPTLMRNLRSGAVNVRAWARLPETTTPSADQIRELLRSADPEDRSVGAALLAQSDLAVAPKEVPELARGADPALRRALLAVLRRAPEPEVGTVLARLLDAADHASQLLGLEAILARREPLEPGCAERLARAGHPAIALLARLAGNASHPTGHWSPEIDRVTRHAESCAALIAALAEAPQEGRLDLLVALVARAPLEQQRQGLGVLRGIGVVGHGPTLDLAKRLAVHPDATLRAEAVALQGAFGSDAASLEHLARGLEDPSRRVRQSAAEALARHGEAAILPAVAHFELTRPEVAEAAIWTLGRIGSRRARDALTDLLQPMYARAERNLHWLARLPADRDSAAWAPFELALEDQNRRILATVMHLLAALGEERLVASLRRALATSDQRTRANALEALVSLPHRRFILPILPLLEAMLLPARAGGLNGNQSDAPSAVLGAAARCADPWLRQGAVCTAKALRIQLHIATHSRAFAANTPRSRAAQHPPTEAEMEQVLFLKRVPLFRYLPLDVLRTLGQALERETYVAGETIFEAGERAEHFCVIESGAVEVYEPDGQVERLVASDYFGELALVEEAPRSPRIVAAEPGAGVLRLHQIVFHDLSWEHPEILMELCKLLARRLRQAQRQSAPLLAARATAPGDVEDSTRGGAGLSTRPR